MKRSQMSVGSLAWLVATTVPLWGCSGVTIPAVNQQPIADAGPDQNARPNQTVQLNGLSSVDPDDDPLTFNWQQRSGPDVSLTGANSPEPSFLAIEEGTYEFVLTVTDDRGGRDSSSVRVFVEDGGGGNGASIEYPETGQFGVNFLHPDLTETISGDMSLHALLEEDASLLVKLILITSPDPDLLPPDSGWSWGFNSPAEVTWIISQYDDGEQEFSSIEGEPHADVRLRPGLRSNPEFTEILIEYYENGDSTPTWTKNVIVTPAE